MKKIVLLLALFAVLAAANVSAHDKGDLVLNIEPYVGVAFPSLSLFEMEMLPGIDFALRGVVDYHLTDFFSVNVGLGYGGNYNAFVHLSGGIPPQLFMAGMVFGILIPPLIPATLGAAQVDADPLGDFFASYITIPIGLRLSPRHFTLGAGATINIPISGSGDYQREEYKHQGWNNKYDGKITFELLPYMGWYVDIGLDSLGKKKNAHKFGVLVRLSGSFADEIAKPSNDIFIPNAAEIDGSLGRYRFNFISAALIFKMSLRLANIPIGGNTD
jgi:hypothetical protein